MNQRSTALTFAVVCLVALFGIALLAPMPYVLLSPGPTENTLGAFGGKSVITIEGHRTYPTTGELRLTTVSETRADYRVRLPQVLEAWWSSDQIVVPRDVVYPPDQSVQQVQQQNTQQMLDSQSTAIAAGLGEAGINAVQVKVKSTVAGTPADGVLQRGDVITALQGKPVHTRDDVVAAITDLAPGTQVKVTYLRAGTSHTVSIPTEANPTGDSRSRIGIELFPDDFDPPFKVSINLGQDIGGPSAGMMFALAIYDKITPGALTGGRNIAGTGTIDVSGNVGEIGGIQQKIAGAYEDGVRTFLVPESNCAEAVGSALADQVELIQVSTLDDAVKALRALDSGITAGITRCGS
jgi:PDZ domain-containing protein